MSNLISSQKFTFSGSKVSAKAPYQLHFLQYLLCTIQTSANEKIPPLPKLIDRIEIWQGETLFQTWTGDWIDIGHLLLTGKKSVTGEKNSISFTVPIPSDYNINYAIPLTSLRGLSVTFVPKTVKPSIFQYFVTLSDYPIMHHSEITPGTLIDANQEPNAVKVHPYQVGKKGVIISSPNQLLSANSLSVIGQNQMYTVTNLEVIPIPEVSIPDYTLQVRWMGISNPEEASISRVNNWSRLVSIPDCKTIHLTPSTEPSEVKIQLAPRDMYYASYWYFTHLSTIQSIPCQIEVILDGTSKYEKSLPVEIFASNYPGIYMDSVCSNPIHRVLTDYYSTALASYCIISFKFPSIPPGYSIHFMQLSWGIWNISDGAGTISYLS